MDKNEEVNKILGEINALDDAGQVEYFIKYFNYRNLKNRKIILELIGLKKAIEDGKIPMPTGEKREGIVSDLKKLWEDQIEIDKWLKELYEIKQAMELI